MLFLIRDDIGVSQITSIKLVIVVKMYNITTANNVQRVVFGNFAPPLAYKLCHF